MDSTIIRNDGKPARTPRLGLQPKRHNGIVADPAEPAPMWHELVQPGPKGFPARTRQRREDRGQVVHLTHEPVPSPNGGRQGGPVRAGIYSPRPTRRAARIVASEQPRAVKGRRQPGLVEVYRQRPINRKRG